MARTNPYVKAEVLEVLEADEGENDAEIESPQSPSSTGSDDDSDVSAESPKRKTKVPERQVVLQTTLKKTSPNSGTNDSTTPLVATRLKRARSVDHSMVKLPDAVRRSNIQSVMESSDDRDPDEFLLSNDFEVRTELLFDESALSVYSMSSTEAMEKTIIMHISDRQRTNAKKSSQDSTAKVRRSTEQEAARYTATGEPSAHRRSRKSPGSTEYIVTVINHLSYAKVSIAIEQIDSLVIIRRGGNSHICQYHTWGGCATEKPHLERLVK